MNVFVLSTGRCGSTTVARAFSHATNYTSGHETRSHLLSGRLEYPRDHIESDNRLSWFLGSLDRRYGNDAWWVHLTRDEERVADSLWRRWEENVRGRRLAGIVRHPRRTAGSMRNWWSDGSSMNRGMIAIAFGYDVVTSHRPLTSDERRLACRLYVQTVNDNISKFLEGKTRTARIRVENFKPDVAYLWERIDAEGPVEDAMRELDVVHNRRC